MSLDPGSTDRRTRRDRRRASRLRERFLIAIAILGAVIGLIGGLTGAVALDRVGGETAARTEDNALASFNGCRRANVQTRPATRITTATLRDLIVFVNSFPGGAGETDPFARAPARLEQALRLLRPQDCPHLYPEGYEVWVERGKPPLAPPPPRASRTAP